MQAKIIFEVETETGYIEVQLRTAKALLATGKYTCENLNFGVEFLEQNEIFRFTLMKHNGED